MERFCESKGYMALFNYFKREKGNLADPHGPLAQSVPSTSIAAANSEVSTAIDTMSRNSRKRGHYEKYTPQQKACASPKWVWF